MIITGFENILGSTFMLCRAKFIPTENGTTTECLFSFQYFVLNQERKLLHIRYTRGRRYFNLRLRSRNQFIKRISRFRTIPVSMFHLID